MPRYPRALPSAAGVEMGRLLLAHGTVQMAEGDLSQTGSNELCQNDISLFSLC